MAAKITNWLGTRSHRSHLSGALLVSNNTQFKTILEDGDEVVEQELSLGQENVGKVRKFSLVDQKIFGDVEDILERMQQPWLGSLQTSSSFLQLSADL